MTITQSQLHEMLNYDPQTGVFTWRTHPSKKVRIRVGDVASSVSTAGYAVIKIFGKPYLAHRLAFLYMRGEWPKNQIDHIDGNRLNNRIENLRDVTAFVNMQNQRRALANNSCGVLGVTRVGNRFQARIKTNRIKVHLGTFATPEEAHYAYLTAKRIRHEGCVI